MEQNDYGTRIRKVRESLHFLQKEFSKETGFSPQDILEWENNVNLPCIAFIIQLNEVFGVNIDWLLTGRGDMIPGDPGAPPRSALLREIDRLIGKMDENTELTVNIRNGSVSDWNLYPCITLITQGKTEPSDEE